MTVLPLLLRPNNLAITSSIFPMLKVTYLLFFMPLALATNDNIAFTRPSLLDNKQFLQQEENQADTQEKQAVKAGEKNQTTVNKENAVSTVTNSVSQVKPKPYRLNLKHLPKRYKHWHLDLIKHDLTGTTECVVKSDKVTVNDGQSYTPVILEATSDSVKLYSESPIDLSYTDIGIKIDHYDLVTPDAVFSETNIIFSFDFENLVTQMKKGRKAEVKLGFWPTSPVKKAYKTNISLEGFSRAMRAFHECQSLLK